MRFGLFIPQGWRLDLVGHPHRKPLAGDARAGRIRRRRRVGLAVGVRPLPHRADADRRGHPRGVVADVGLRRHHVAHQARPDVHGDELPQSGLSGQGGRHRRHHLRRPGPDGYRRRLVRARVAAHTGTASRRQACGWRRLDEGVQIMRDAWRDGGSRSTASTIRSTARSSRRSRCRTAVFRCGSPAAARR